MANCKCEFCGSKNGKTNMRGLCQACYKYFVLQKKKLYPTYEGAIQYTDEGDAICPECGKAFRKLGGHIHQAHNMTTKEFFEKHGWSLRKTKASNLAYRNHMRNIQEPKTIWVNLFDKSIKNRFGVPNTGNPMAVNKLVVNHRCSKCKYFNESFCAKHNKECKFIIGCKENAMLCREGE